MTVKTVGLDHRPAVDCTAINERDGQGRFSSAVCFGHQTQDHQQEDQTREADFLL
jgi:hypothetical protein